MSARKKKLTVGTALLAVAALVLFQVLSTEPVPNPSYNGMRLSGWLTTTNTAGMTFNGGGFAIPTEAVRALGTNAIPYLGFALVPEKKPLEQLWNFLGSATGWWKPKYVSSHREIRAVECLRELGKEYPDLVRPHLVRAFLLPETTLGAGNWLGHDGVTNLPVLTNALIHHDPDIRLSAVQSTGFVGKDALISLPTIESILKTEASTNHILREVCLQAVGKIGHEQPQTARLLTNYISDHYEMARMSAIHSLGKCGTNAAMALPQLIHALSDSSRHVRQAAGKVLKSLQGGNSKPLFAPHAPATTNSNSPSFPMPQMQPKKSQ